MKQSRMLSGVAAGLGMLVLILDGKTALSGAAEGVKLCLRTVIPSLFPFFVLSGILTTAFFGTPLGLLRPLGRLCRIPPGAESFLITGFLGGYPVGAQSIGGAYRSGQISKTQAQRLIGFCNNAGPSFLFGMIAPTFPHPGYAWLLWLIHIISAILVALCIPAAETDGAALKPGKTVSLPEALWNAIRVTASVCGWIVLFRVGIGFLERWIFWLFPDWMQVLLTGLLELSNGCCCLTSISDIHLRFIVCSGMLAFGGLCVTMQTVSVTSGLSLRQYFPGKILQTAFSILLSWLVLPKSTISPAAPVVAACIGVLLIGYLEKRKNNSSIPRLIGV